MSNRIKWSFVGIADHQGVENVGGRIGAAKAPESIWAAFKRMNGKSQIFDSLEQRQILTQMGRNVSENHALAATAITQAHQSAGRTVVVGGGHDHGYSHLKGISKFIQSKPKSRTLGCINIDAHLDVRAPQSGLITSGSPFYLALEDQVISAKNFIEFGIQSHCNAPALWEYIKRKEVKVVNFDELRFGKAVSTFQKVLKKLSSQCDAIVISFDIDAIAESHAPGVSAPQAEGFTASEAIAMVELAGLNPKVCSLGLFEVNPELDLDQRTARLAATLAYHFIEASIR